MSSNLMRIHRTYLGILCFALLDLVASRNMGDIVASGFGLSDATAITAGPFTNTSENLCWMSWTDYWSYTQAIASPKTSDVSTIVTKTTGYDSGFSGTTETYISTIKGTSVQDNGGFTISTMTLDSVATSVLTISARPGSSYTGAYTFTSVTLLSYDGRSIQVPTCRLSSIVPQCQGQWEVYASSQLLPSPTPPSHCDIN